MREKVRQGAGRRAMAGDTILVLNAGSSSVKFSLFRSGGGLLREGQVSGVGGKARLRVKAGEGEDAIELPAGAGHHGALQTIEGWLGQHRAALRAVGHRV